MTISIDESVRKTRRINTILADSISILANSFLLFLVIAKTKTKLRPYKKVLILNSIIDLCYTVLSLLVQSVWFAKDNLYYIVLDGLIPELPEPYNFLLTAIQLFTLYLCMTTVPIQFLYRCNLVLRSKEFSNLFFCALILIPVIFTAGYVYSFSTLFYPVDRDIDRFGDVFIDANWVNDDGELPSFYVTYTNRTTSSTVITYATLLITIPYLIAFICAILITLKLKSVEKTMSPKTRLLQRQITLVLVIQALAPLLTLILPMTIHILSLKILNIEWTEFACTILFAWSPVINPLVTLAMLAPYRKLVVQMVSTAYDRTLSVARKSTGLTPKSSRKVVYSSLLQSSSNNQANNSVVLNK